MKVPSSMESMFTMSRIPGTNPSASISSVLQNKHRGERKRGKDADTVAWARPRLGEWNLEGEEGVETRSDEHESGMHAATLPTNCRKAQLFSKTFLLSKTFFGGWWHARPRSKACTRSQGVGLWADRKVLVCGQIAKYWFVGKCGFERVVVGCG